jgi:hypothetical protein
MADEQFFLIEELDTAWRKTLQLQRNTDTGLLIDACIAEDPFDRLTGEFDGSETEIFAFDVAIPSPIMD